MEANILSSGGVLKPYTDSQAMSNISSAIGADERSGVEHSEEQSCLAFLLNDDWLQCVHTEE